MKLELKDNMSKNLITVNKNATCGEAYKIMASEWIRHLPVLDDSQDIIVGILSDRDIYRAPHSTAPVSDVMSAPVKSFDISTPIRTVVTAMIDEKMSAFLITNKNEVAGIVTSEDMLLLLSQLLNTEPSKKWILSEFLMNPVLQRTLNMTAQAGI